MRSLIAALLVCLLSLTSACASQYHQEAPPPVPLAPAPAFPWATFNDLGSAATGVQVAQCGDVVVLKVTVERDSDFFVVFVADNGRVLVAYVPDKNGVPTWIAFGHIEGNVYEANAIPSLRWQRFDIRLHEFICGLLNARLA